MLRHIGSGGQGHVFAGDGWAIKIRRRSLLSLLGRMVVPPSFHALAAEALGDLVVPFAILGPVRFVAPSLKGSLLTAEKIEAAPPREYRHRRAIAMPLLPAGRFLHRELDHAAPTVWAKALPEILAVLRAVKARGFYLLDPIMGNFARGEDGAIRIADPGLIAPARYLREPSIGITARQFASRLASDYADLCARSCAAHRSDPAADSLPAIAADFGDQLRALRRWNPECPDPPKPVAFPADLRAQIENAVAA